MEKKWEKRSEKKKSHGINWIFRSDTLRKRYIKEKEGYIKEFVNGSEHYVCNLLEIQ